MKDHEYYAYIACSGSGTLYIGMTNSEIEGFAARYHCNRLVWHEGHDDVRKAIDREKQLKGWTRGKKTAVIESKNPRWEDLAEKWEAEMQLANQSIQE